MSSFSLSACHYQVYVSLAFILQHVQMMASRKAAVEVAKLHAVTLIRSGIGRPYWQKRTLEALGLTKLHKTMIHKNIPSVNGMLRSVKELVKVQPVVLRSDMENSPSRGEFFLDNGQVFLKQKWKQTSGRRRPRAHREKTVTTDGSK